MLTIEEKAQAWYAQRHGGSEHGNVREALRLYRHYCLTTSEPGIEECLVVALTQLGIEDHVLEAIRRIDQAIMSGQR